MSDFHSLLQNNIKIMNDLSGFDVVMVCCSSSKQAAFWQARLEKGRGSVLPTNCMVLSVEEDWEGGAGNALGTLYAFQKAAKLAKDTHSSDILADLVAGKISIGLFHTAGKGTRLAPLPGSENNNKPGVKLPSTIVIEGQQVPMTILEAVIKQTGCYAKSRKGRLSVFWGDQVFIPTAPVEYEVTHHVDILCSLGPTPTEEQWKAKGMDKYGLIAQNVEGNAAQVEKVSHATAMQLLKSLGEIPLVGASLGSFSLSHQMLATLLDEFSSELAAKVGKLDSDPHLWMPMTLTKDSYLQIMAQKGVAADVSSAHFERISAMMTRFDAQPGIRDQLKGLFGAVDVGQGVCWWDYGQLKLYQKNTLMMTEDTPEAELMRSFLGLSPGTRVRDSQITNTDVDARSCVSSSVLGSDGATTGFVRNSVLSNVRCRHIEADGCVLINVTADSIIARAGSIVYNYVHALGAAEAKAEAVEPPAKRTRSEGNIKDQDQDKDTAATAEADTTTTATTTTVSAVAGDVIVGVFGAEGAQVVMRSHIETDGGKVWDDKVHANPHSFGDVYDLNKDVCPTKLQKIIAQLHDDAWQKL